MLYEPKRDKIHQLMFYLFLIVKLNFHQKVTKRRVFNKNVSFTYYEIFT